MSTSRSAKPVVLITGGGTGIGAAVAREMAVSHQVVICGRRMEPLQHVAAETRAFPIQADLGQQSEAERSVAETLQRFGRLDALVLNAGIVRAAPFAETSVNDWHGTLQTNLNGPFYLARAAIPHLRETGGAMVGVASAAALFGAPGLSAYSVSKSGLLTMMRAIVRDHAAEGIRANVVCPGWVRTEMADEELQGIADERGVSLEEMYAEVTKNVPCRRPAQPKEAASPIVFLLSPAASYINGAILCVDGGSTAVDVGTLAF